MLAFYTRLARDFGDVASYRLGPRLSVLLSHPDLIEQVLVTDNRNFIKNFGTRLLKPTLGNGLLLSEGDEWLKHRRLMQPLFSRQRIDSYAPMIVAATQRQIENWRDNPRRDLHQEMLQLTLTVVTQALLGSDSYANAAAVNQAAVAIQNDFNSRFQSAFPIPFWLPHPKNWRLRRQIRRLEVILQQFINERRQRKDDRDDLLSLLIRARDDSNQTGLSDRQLRDEVMTIFLAGHETTANALAWTWSLLIRHPQMFARLFDEVDAVLVGRPPTAADVARLTFIEHVFLESMRLYPPAYVIGREVQADYQIGGFTVPAGASLMMSQWVMHRDPRFFERPEEFDPDRWKEAELRKRTKYAYFPFGGGPRVCIGNSFALFEAVLVIATVAQEYEIATAGEPTEMIPSVAVTLRPKGGVPALVTRRCEKGQQQRARVTQKLEGQVR